MYSKKRNEIIQDMMGGLNNSLDQLSEINKNQQEAKRENDICNWVESQDWKSFSCIALIMTWTIISRLTLIALILTPALFLLAYSVVQFEFATTFRPEFVAKWIQTLDKSTWPYIFHPNIGHPILLTTIWLITTITAIMSTFVGFTASFTIIKEGVKELFEKSAENIIQLILGCFVIPWLVSSGLLYLWNNQSLLDKVSSILTLICVIVFCGFCLSNGSSSSSSGSSYSSSNSTNNEWVENENRRREELAEKQRQERTREEELAEKQRQRRTREEELRNTIATCVQRGRVVYVYNAKNSILFTRTGNLRGYTSHTVTIECNRAIYTHNVRGSIISTHHE